MKRKSAKPVKNPVYDVVRNTLHKYDPESTLKLGAPPDEYDAVCSQVAEVLIREGGSKLSVTQVSNILALALHLEFSMWSRPVTLHALHFEMAKEILPQLSGVKLK